MQSPEISIRLNFRKIRYDKSSSCVGRKVARERTERSTAARERGNVRSRIQGAFECSCLEVTAKAVNALKDAQHRFLLQFYPFEVRTLFSSIWSFGRLYEIPQRLTHISLELCHTIIRMQCRRLRNAELLLIVSSRNEVHTLYFKRIDPGLFACEPTQSST